MGYIREIVIESKLFSVVREGGLVRITERGRRLKQELLLGLGTVQWLQRALEDSVRGNSKDFYASKREGYRSFIAQCRVNNHGRFLEVAVYGEGGCRSFILIPEEEEERGWRRMWEVLKEVTQANRNGVRQDGDVQRRH